MELKNPFCLDIGGDITTLKKKHKIWKKQHN